MNQINSIITNTVNLSKCSILREIACYLETMPLNELSGLPYCYDVTIILYLGKKCHYTVPLQSFPGCKDGAETPRVKTGIFIQTL